MLRHSKTIDKVEKWLLYDFWSAALMAMYLSEYDEVAIEWMEWNGVTKTMICMIAKTMVFMAERYGNDDELLWQ